MGAGLARFLPEVFFFENLVSMQDFK